MNDVPTYSHGQKIFAEFIGSLFLLATIVGSGIMAENLAGGSAALALMCNTIAVGAILIVLITMLGPVSGAHLNPAVTLGFRLKGDIGSGLASGFIAAQIAGAILGVWLTHIMFDLSIIQTSNTARTGGHILASEALATFGLMWVIFATLKTKASAVPMAVGLYIIAAYWFTSSTSFANPAVTLARSLSDTFVGIRPIDAPAFIIVQCVGAIIAFYVYKLSMEPKITTLRANVDEA